MLIYTVKVETVCENEMRTMSLFFIAKVLIQEEETQKGVVKSHVRTWRTCRGTSLWKTPVAASATAYIL
jgi:hypothetical protein